MQWFLPIATVIACMLDMLRFVVRAPHWQSLGYSRSLDLQIRIRHLGIDGNPMHLLLIWPNYLNRFDVWARISFHSYSFCLSITFADSISRSHFRVFNWIYVTIRYSIFDRRDLDACYWQVLLSRRRANRSDVQNTIAMKFLRDISGWSARHFHLHS